MENVTLNESELKLKLFRFIDTLSEKKLREFYNLLILSQEEQSNDFWDLLSKWEKEDIEAGISDLDNGKFKNVDDVLAKY